MQITHVDLKTLFSLLHRQQEDIEALTARLAVCQSALDDLERKPEMESRDDMVKRA